MYYLIITSLVLLFFAAGYFAGKRHGRNIGFEQGELYAPLELRRQGLESGRCKICGTKLNRKMNVIEKKRFNKFHA